MRIVGHTKQQEMLESIARSGSPSHGYLFFGPDRIGKFLVAEQFARALVLHQEGKVSDFLSDIFLLEPEQEEKKGIVKEKSLSVDSIRELRVFLSQYPANGRFRVAIIRDAHQLLEPAQNALLKTLEEPSDTAVILLITDRPGALLPTLLSRIERVSFHPIPEEEMRRSLSESSVEPFFFSLGRPGLIIEALSDPEHFADRKDVLRSLFRIESLSVQERIALSERLSKNVPEALELLDWWKIGWRSHLAKSENEQEVQRKLLLLSRAERATGILSGTNANARLVLDDLFLS